jgi:hypothetical protein
MIFCWVIRPVTLRVLLFMMGAVSPRAYADAWLKQELLAAMNGYCPKVVVQLEDGQRCTEGEPGCFSDDAGKKALAEVKKGCEVGRGGEGQTCLYGLYIDRTGHATAICGPRMLDASAGNLKR